MRKTSPSPSATCIVFCTVVAEMGQSGMSMVNVFLITGTVTVHGAPHASQVTLNGTSRSILASTSIFDPLTMSFPSVAFCAPQIRSSGLCSERWQT